MREVSTGGLDTRLDCGVGVPKVVGLLVGLDVEDLDLQLDVTLRLGPHATHVRSLGRRGLRLDARHGTD